MCEVAPVSRYQSGVGARGWCCYNASAFRAWMREFWSQTGTVRAAAPAVGGSYADGADQAGGAGTCEAVPTNGTVPPGRGPRMPAPGTWGRHGIGQAWTIPV